MSEEQTLDKKQELQNKYNQLCFTFGLVEFNRKALEAQSESLLKQLFEVKQAFEQLTAAEAQNG